VVLEAHRHRLRHTDPHADLELIDDVQLPGIGHTTSTALVEFCRVVASDRCRAGEHGSAVRLLRSDARQRR
jgi:hypothetical protein